MKHEEIGRLKKWLHPFYVAEICILIIVTIFSIKPQMKIDTINYSYNVDPADIALEGYSLYEGIYKSVTNDPYMFLPTADGSVNLLEIDFGNTDRITGFVVYSPFEAPYSVDTDSPNGICYVNLIENVYPALRLDIDGQFSINSIRYINGSLKNGIYINYAAILLTLTVLVIFTIVYARYKLPVCKYIKETLFCGEGYSHSKEYCRRLSKLFFLLSICAGMMIIFINPPSAGPDEHHHFFHVAKIARFDLFPDVKDGEVGIYITEDEKNFIYYSGHQMSYEKIDSMTHLTNNSNMEFTTEFGANSPIGYLISGLGTGLIQNITGPLSPYYIFIIGKIFNLVFSSVIIAVAIYRSPCMNNTMFLLALMPMSLYQCASLSYDAMVIPCSFLLFAYTAKILRSSEGYTVAAEDIFAICLSCFFLIGCKSGAYAPLILILLALNIKKFKNIKQYIVCIILVILMGIISYIVPSMIISNISRGVITENPLVEGQKEFVLSNPLSVPIIIFNTISGNLLFLANSFVGNLGWLDICLPLPIIVIYAVVLLISFLSEASIIPKSSVIYKCLVTVGFLISFIGIFLSMYIFYTATYVNDIGTNYIIGVQGRYLIPIAIFGMSIFANPLLYRFRYTEALMKFEGLIVPVTSITALCITILILYSKYWTV